MTVGSARGGAGLDLDRWPGAAFGMIRLWVVIFFLVALIYGIVDVNVASTNGAAGAFRRAVVLFVVPGLISLVWWGIGRKFAGDRVGGPLILWALLEFGLIGMNIRLALYEQSIAVM